MSLVEQLVSKTRQGMNYIQDIFKCTAVMIFPSMNSKKTALLIVNSKTLTARQIFQLTVFRKFYRRLSVK